MGASKKLHCFYFTSQATTLLGTDLLPLNLFKEEVEPILALIAGLVGVGRLGETSKVCVFFLWLMSQKGVVLDIPGYLSASIHTQFQELPETSHFHFCSLVFYLFLYQHADRFERLGLDRVYEVNSQP